MNKKEIYTTKEFEDRLIYVARNAISMASACAQLGMHFNTFKRYALKLNVYKTNEPGKGITKRSRITPLNDILDGLYPDYNVLRLKQRLIRTKIFEHKCYNCLLTEWLRKPIPLELHHKDGNKYNHKLSNIQLLCPNCHAFTSTYRGKNSSRSKS